MDRRHIRITGNVPRDAMPLRCYMMTKLAEADEIGIIFVLLTSDLYITQGDRSLFTIFTKYVNVTHLPQLYETIPRVPFNFDRSTIQRRTRGYCRLPRKTPRRSWVHCPSDYVIQQPDRSRPLCRRSLTSYISHLRPLRCATSRPRRVMGKRSV